MCRQRFGVNVRLIGMLFPNPKTGQVTAVVAENPQAPFSSFKVHIDGGPKGTLTTPGTCGPHRHDEIGPWAGNPPATPADSNTTLTPAAGWRGMPEDAGGPAFRAGLHRQVG